MSIRNFLVHTAACFIPNREKRKAFRRRYRLPETAELLRGRVTVLEETAKKLEDKVKYLQQKEKEYAEAERIKAEEREAHKEFAERGCVPQINGEGNKIIIRENGVFRGLGAGERVAGFAEIIIEGSDNILELEFPLAASNCTIHMIGKRHYCKICPTFKFMNNFIFFFAGDTSLTIGKNTTIRDTTIGLDYKSCIEIGQECMIAEAAIRGTDFHTIYDTATREILNIPHKALHIGNRVWLGEKCRILKNAEIADGCIVGAETVVAKVFDEPDCAIAGNQAKIVKRGITWDRATISEYMDRGPWTYNQD